jgi:D-beta-D-heptose 7-phosphate kinase/D-beta-D-heptose 1-phosphate adenosyltransferase
MKRLSLTRVRAILEQARRARVLVVGDVMLDQFIWGTVSRISPEAPVPVVDFHHESYMPGGAANVARNLTALGGQADVFSIIGNDPAGRQLQELLHTDSVECRHLMTHPARRTTIKTRILAQQQQVVRVDRETRGHLDHPDTRALLKRIRAALPGAEAVVVGDYGKGVVTQELLDGLKALCRTQGVWLSLDPKPVHRLDLSRISLITPNRKEAFELAGVEDGARRGEPLGDPGLRQVADALLRKLSPALLLITLGEQGMLLCQRDRPPFHIPTVAREVFDVSGAGDTVIASFTLAIAAGASPLEAAMFSNHAAGVVVGKVGTATVTPAELRASFQRRS